MAPRTRTRIHSRPRRSPPKGPWKHGSIPVIGLIGGIGGGKSRVAAILAAHGALVLEADAVGHALLNQRPVREQVIARFGTGILAPSSDAEAPPVIDRRALGAIVFAKPEALRDLEAIVHPRMRGTFERAIARAERRGKSSAVVLDAAILLEAGWNTLCDRVVYVEAPRDVRLGRLVAERGWTDEKLAARERAQWPAEEKRRQSDAVIDNDAGIDRLEDGVQRFWNELLAPASRARPSHRPEGGPRRR